MRAQGDIQSLLLDKLLMSASIPCERTNCSPEFRNLNLTQYCNVFSHEVLNLMVINRWVAKMAHRETIQSDFKSKKGCNQGGKSRNNVIKGRFKQIVENEEKCKKKTGFAMIEP